MQNYETYASLRLIQTTDLHGHIVNFDYMRGERIPSEGLALASQSIKRLRQEAHDDGHVAMLFDCGDFLQGNPACDSKPTPNPMIAAMNLLRYDAVCLGNHDFTYGFEYLATTLEQADFPVLMGNAHAPKFYPLPTQERVITEVIWPSTGRSVDHAKVGIYSVLPPITGKWEAGNLEATLACDDILDRAREHESALRAEGAELVICLCHSGISDAPYHHGMENAAFHIAREGLADAILAGHAHQRFPGPDLSATEDINPDCGRLAGVPTIMSGQFGRYVGSIDLRLDRDAAGNLYVVDSTCALHRTIDAHYEPGNCLPMVRDMHEAAIAEMQETIGETQAPLQSGLEQLTPGPVSALVAESYLNAAQDMLRDHPARDLPRVAMVSPFCAGGFGDASNFVSIEPGSIERRHVHQILPFTNKIILLEANGAILREWLEQSASLLAHVPPGAQDVPLVEGPDYMLDRAYGLEYEIDLSVPPRYEYSGTQVSDSHRIGPLKHNGTPIGDTDALIVATTQFRAAGSAPITAPKQAQILPLPLSDARDYLESTIRRQSGNLCLPLHWGATFRPVPQASISICASNDALSYSHPLASRLSPLPEAKNGVSRLRFSLE